MKSTSTYWNPLSPENVKQWTDVEGTDGNISVLTIAEDPDTGDYTRLTRIAAGFSTAASGAQCHDYPEEILMLEGRLFDEAFGVWLEPGCYASRPPGEVHGPFRAEGDVVVLEMSYPSQAQSKL